MKIKVKDKLENESSNLDKFDSPLILKHHETFLKDQLFICIITEYCNVRKTNHIKRISLYCFKSSIIFEREVIWMR